MPSEVFLSYSHDADERLIDELKKFFDARHIETFSYKHDDRGHGDLLDARIESAIKSSARLFFVITDGALESDWVKLEIKLAEQHRKYSVAVAYHGVNLNRVPTYLTKRKAIVYTTYKSALDELSNIDWGIDVYIPAAGYGGREFSQNFPKALYPIGDRPMLFHVINALNGERFNRIVCLNRKQYLPELTNYLVSREKFPTQVICSDSDAEGWPQAIADHRPMGTFLVQLSDVILWLPGDEPEDALQDKWRSVVRQHQNNALENDYLGTLIVSEYYKISAGKVKIKGNSAITKVEENPIGRLVQYINTGTALLEPTIFDYVQPSDRSLLGEAIVRAMDDGKRFGSFIWRKWYHVLNPNDWLQIHEEYLRRSSQPPQGAVTGPGGVEGGPAESSALGRDTSALPPPSSPVS